MPPARQQPPRRQSPTRFERTNPSPEPPDQPEPGLGGEGTPAPPPTNEGWEQPESPPPSRGPPEKCTLVDPAVAARRLLARSRRGVLRAGPTTCPFFSLGLRRLDKDTAERRTKQILLLIHPDKAAQHGNDPDAANHYLNATKHVTVARTIIQDGFQSPDKRHECPHCH